MDRCINKTLLAEHRPGDYGIDALFEPVLSAIFIEQVKETRGGKQKW